MIGFVSSWDRCLKSGFWDSESFQTFDGLKVFGEDETVESWRSFVDRRIFFRSLVEEWLDSEIRMMD